MSEVRQALHDSREAGNECGRNLSPEKESDGGEEGGLKKIVETNKTGDYD